ncbi:TPA: HNH endonuclease [Yersinia enterocolitica]
MPREKSKRIQLPDISILTSTFSYNPETGALIRIKGSTKSNLAACGSTSANGYMSVRVDGVLYSVHRIIWKMVTGKEPMHLDHINGIRTDNRISNLREVSRTENNRNIGISPRNTSGYAGVTFVKSSKKWAAQLKINKRQISGGLFINKIDAVLAFNVLAMKFHGEFAKRRVEHNVKQLIEEYGSDYELKRETHSSLQS